MTSSVEQPAGRPRSAGTRRRLIEAACALIGELGWAQVTTRAVAARAELPLGAVSYHFPGKQELLTQAGLAAVEEMFPIDQLDRVKTLPELVRMFHAATRPGEASDGGTSPVLLETMREAGRNSQLRERMARLLGEYRQILARLLHTEQQRGTVSAAVDPAAVAALVAAAGDGLVLHALIDPDLDVSSAMRALLDLVSAAGGDPDTHR